MLIVKRPVGGKMENLLRPQRVNCPNGTQKNSNRAHQIPHKFSKTKKLKNKTVLSRNLGPIFKHEEEIKKAAPGPK